MALSTDVDRLAVERRILGDGPGQKKFLQSLNLIWTACENAWPEELGPIVRDYTDHGPKHVLRILGWIEQLLSVGRDVRLSHDEAYVLLAATYLHDIGMQCNVASRQEIQSLLRQNGVVAPWRWEPKSTSDYSLDEQRWVRKHHAALAGAWLESARDSTDHILGAAACSIADEFVGDIIQLIASHTGPPLAECPEQMEFRPHGRLRLLAAILRFADELDIDSSRVSDPKVIAQFSLDAENMKFWWLHNFTHIELSENNLSLVVALSPFDHGPCSGRVRDSMVVGFQQKNQAAMTILADHGIGLTFSGDVRLNKHNKRLPGPIRELLLDASPSSEAPLLALVSTYMTALGFDVVATEHALGPSCLCALSAGVLQQTILCICLEGPATEDDVQLVAEHAESEGGPITWLISSGAVSSEAASAGEMHSWLTVMDSSAFVRKVWAPYAAWLASMVRDAGVDQTYEDPPCYQWRKRSVVKGGRKVYRPDNYRSLHEFARGWIHGNTGHQLMLLGPFGSGKTSFARKFCSEQLAAFFDAPLKERLPLLLSLRDLAKAVSVQAFVSSTLTEKHRTRPSGSPWTFFDTLNRAGRLVVVLDGFDEMAQRLDDQLLSANFVELLQLVNPASRLVLTSRTECFNRASQEEGLAQGASGATVGAGSITFELLYIADLRWEQVERLVQSRWGAVYPAVASRILGDSRLMEMAAKPVLIDLLVEALADDPSIALPTYAAVYDTAVRAVLARNSDRSCSSEQQKLAFLTLLGWLMMSNEQTRVYFADVPPIIVEAMSGERLDQASLDQLDHDMRTQTLLHRDAAGYYEFAHKSLADYFAAVHLSQQLDSAMQEPRWEEAISAPVGVGFENWEAISPFLGDLICDSTLLRLWVFTERWADSLPEGLPQSLLLLFNLALADTGDDLLEDADLPEDISTEIRKIDGQWDRGLITRDERNRQRYDTLLGRADAPMTPERRAPLREVARAFVSRRLGGSIPELPFSEDTA